MTHTRWERVAAMVATIALLAVGGSVHAQHEQREQVSVAGRWTMSVSGPHTTTLRLTLEQEETKVKGALENPHGGSDFQAAGTLVGRRLTLTGTSGTDLELSGELKDDGTMAGTLSSARGDLQWVAKRVAGSR